jgi:hypothetical protein
MKFRMIPIIITLLWLACTTDGPELYINYTRQFGETIHILDQKNDFIYTDLEYLYFEYQEKMAPFHQKAGEIKKAKDSIDKILDSLLAKVSIAHKKRESVFNEENADLIRQNIAKYRKLLISTINDTPKYPQLIENIGNTLSLSGLDDLIISNNHAVNPEKEEACLWKLKADITLAESDILDYLYSQFDTGSFKFTTTEVFVVPNSQVLPTGYPFRAEIYLASRDTTISVDYEIDGRKYNVVSGIGKYSEKPAIRPGFYQKNGTFLIKSPYTGEIQKVPFRIEYEVSGK